jgi:hypothetical protein
MSAVPLILKEIEMNVLQLIVMTALLVALPTSAVLAQVAPGANVLKIRKFEALGNKTSVRTPIFQTGYAGPIQRQREWYQLVVRYDTAPEWLDQLVVSYYVMTMKQVEGRPAYSLFKKRVTYLDIAKGRDHMATAYLRPTTLLKYGPVVAAAAELSFKTAQGEVTVPLQDTATRLPERWWINPKVVESATVSVRDGLLLDRSQTPFAVINTDDYEVMQ